MNLRQSILLYLSFQEVGYFSFRSNRFFEIKIKLIIRLYFRGGGPKTNSTEEFARLSQLKEDIQLLDNQEKMLDEQIKILQMNNAIASEDEDYQK
jgi:hypothetical protein